MDCIYDIEVFHNFFCITFLDIAIGIPISFKVCSWKDERREIIKWVKKCNTLIGFNSISYDDPMLRYLLEDLIDLEADVVASSLYYMSQRLIAPNSNEDEDIRNLRYSSGRGWNQIDLMKMMAFDRLGVGLKQVAINLEWDLIQDLPYDFDAIVDVNMVDTIVKYNKNDVMITFKLWRKLQEELALRQEIGKLYNVNLMSASDSKMANILFEKFYCERTGQKPQDLKFLRTVRDEIKLSDVISQKISFSSNTMVELLARLKEITVRAENKYAFKETFEYGGLTYEIGIGGLHSKDQPGKFVADSNSIIRDADVASYYPNIIIKHNISPKHLNKKAFTEVLEMITKERLEAKKNGEKKKADALKITINSVFGKLSSNTFWLEDMDAFLKVTLQGQLYLLMLIEALDYCDIQVISANTDGVLCQFPLDKNTDYIDMCNLWQQKTGFNLEFTDYNQYIRSDVNDYIAEKMDKTVKEKGRFLRNVDLKKGYKYPIIPEAIYRFFIHGVPVRETLESCQDIMAFCVSQKIGGQFKAELHTTTMISPLQKNIRFFISNSGAALHKRNTTTGKTTGLFVGEYVTLLNNHKPEMDYEFEKYNVDLDFYEKEAYKIIDEIQPRIVQMRMFE